MNAGVIMVGDGRWAENSGRPVSAGRKAGVGALRRAVEATPKLGVNRLAVHAFSADDWRRPPTEVDALMASFLEALPDGISEFAAAGARPSSNFAAATDASARAIAAE